MPKLSRFLLPWIARIHITPISIVPNCLIPISLSRLADFNCPNSDYPTFLRKWLPRSGRFWLPQIVPIQIARFWSARISPRVSIAQNFTDFICPESACPDSDLPWIWLPRISLIPIAPIPLAQIDLIPIPIDSHCSNSNCSELPRFRLTWFQLPRFRLPWIRLPVSDCPESTWIQLPVITLIPIAEIPIAPNLIAPTLTAPIPLWNRRVSQYAAACAPSGLSRTSVVITDCAMCYVFLT